MIVTVVAIIVTYIELHYNLQGYTLTITPFTLIGVALSIFLGFRNNAAYDRFWERRELWGSLVNTSSSLARQAYSLIDSPHEDQSLQQFREVFILRIIAFVHAIRCHLRDEDPLDEIEKISTTGRFTSCY